MHVEFCASLLTAPGRGEQSASHYGPYGPTQRVPGATPIWLMEINISASVENRTQLVQDPSTSVPTEIFRLNRETIKVRKADWVVHITWAICDIATLDVL